MQKSVPRIRKDTKATHLYVYVYDHVFWVHLPTVEAPMLQEVHEPKLAMHRWIETKTMNVLRSTVPVKMFILDRVIQTKLK